MGLWAWFYYKLWTYSIMQNKEENNLTWNLDLLLLVIHNLLCIWGVLGGSNIWGKDVSVMFLSSWTLWLMCPLVSVTFTLGACHFYVHLILDDLIEVFTSSLVWQMQWAYCNQVGINSRDCSETVIKEEKCRKMFPQKRDWQRFHLITLLAISQYSDFLKKQNIKSIAIPRSYYNKCSFL